MQSKSFSFAFRYTCSLSDEYKKKQVYFWNTTVSSNCCTHCNGTVYKADAVIDSVEYEDDCKSIETSVCRIIPSLERAKIQTEIVYRECCHDATGIKSLNTTVFQPETCSQRVCYHNNQLPHSLWYNEKVIVFSFYYLDFAVGYPTFAHPGH